MGLLRRQQGTENGQRTLKNIPWNNCPIETATLPLSSATGIMRKVISCGGFISVAISRFVQHESRN